MRAGGHQSGGQLCPSGPASQGMGTLGPDPRGLAERPLTAQRPGGCSKLRGLTDQQVLLTSVPQPHSRVSTSQMES